MRTLYTTAHNGAQTAHKRDQGILLTERDNLVTVGSGGTLISAPDSAPIVRRDWPCVCVRSPTERTNTNQRAVVRRAEVCEPGTSGACRCRCGSPVTRFLSVSRSEGYPFCDACWSELPAGLAEAEASVRAAFGVKLAWDHSVDRCDW